MLGQHDIHIVDRLARGGMAEVFLGVVDSSRGETWVVVKRVLPEFASDEVYRNLFDQERRIVASLQHPNIVRSIASQGGSEQSLLMEYIDGTSLYELLVYAREQGQEFPVHVVAFWLSQACRGAHAAHEMRDGQGEALDVLHRDLTPHNLMVTPSGTLKIIDFGIATTGASQTLLQQRTVKGKTSYLSPECASQQQQDRRSDIYTLGVVGIELLTGERMQRVQPSATHAPAFELKRTDVPEALTHVLERATAKERTTRWRTAAELEAALAPFWVPHQDRVQHDTATLIQSVVGPVLDARRAHYLSMKRQHRIPLRTLRGRSWEEVQATVRGALIRGQHQRDLRQRYVVGFAVTITALFASSHLPSVASSEAPIDAPPPIRIASALQHELPLQVDTSPSVQWLEARVNANQPLPADATDYDALLFPGDRSPPPGWSLIATAEVNGQTTHLEQIVASIEPTKHHHVSTATLCISGTATSLEDAVTKYQEFTTGSVDTSVRIQQMATDERVLRAILAGACSAGVVAGDTYATASLGGLRTEPLRVIGTTRVRPTPVVLVRESFRGEQRQQLRRVLAELEPDAHSAAHMYEAITGFSIADDSTLEPSL